jgi:hypothetical protein
VAWSPPREACWPMRRPIPPKRAMPRKSWRCWHRMASPPRIPTIGRSLRNMREPTIWRKSTARWNLTGKRSMPTRRSLSNNRNPSKKQTANPTWSPFLHPPWTVCGRARCAGCWRTVSPAHAWAARPPASARSSTPSRNRPPKPASTCPKTTPR